MTAIEETLNSLREFIKNNNVAEVNAPVGVSFSASGEYVCVLYSLSSLTAHRTISDAISEIDEFLNQQKEK